MLRRKPAVTPTAAPHLDPTYCIPLRLSPESPILALLSFDVDQCVDLYRKAYADRAGQPPTDNDLADWFVYAFSRVADGPTTSIVAQQILGFMDVKRYLPRTEAMFKRATPQTLEAESYRLARIFAALRLTASLESPASEVLDPFLNRQRARLTVGEAESTNDGQEPTLGEYIGLAVEGGERAALKDIGQWLCRNKDVQSKQHGAGRNWYTVREDYDRTRPLMARLMAFVRDSAETTDRFVGAPRDLEALVNRIKKAGLDRRFSVLYTKGVAGSFAQMTRELLVSEYRLRSVDSLKTNMKKIRRGESKPTE